MADPASTPFKCILFEKRVRFRLPADWLEGQEAGIGVFQPPQEGGGTLRVTSEVLSHAGPPGDGDLAAATRVILRQTAENFVRPDDPRGSDRIVEQLDDGGLIASYSARTEVDGDKLVIYLWMRGKAMAETVTIAVFSFAMAQEKDGDEEFAAIVGMLDSEIRAAGLGQG
ncbi:hypothetical protein GGE65_001984 [Skermanella aerolata]|uniref:DUF1795 domain-containing protein n=1 Tax=Skermanella aerolata TaxID=393310 RepID=A0A512DP37_9PROT|nr:hypothetical protein [Skermanella aerolata]KJB95749.1 hypothetical protein N826_40270 [Skermanella aerolata KACC 11604]GEO38241.1 hypothetical protein SAE02_23890 [Skermanella aerolata]